MHDLTGNHKVPEFFLLTADFWFLAACNISAKVHLIYFMSENVITLIELMHMLRITNTFVNSNFKMMNVYNNAITMQ